MAASHAVPRSPFLCCYDQQSLGEKVPFPFLLCHSVVHDGSNNRGFLFCRFFF